VKAASAFYARVRTLNDLSRMHDHCTGLETCELAKHEFMDPDAFEQHVKLSTPKTHDSSLTQLLASDFLSRFTCIAHISKQPSWDPINFTASGFTVAHTPLPSINPRILIQLRTHRPLLDEHPPLPPPRQHLLHLIPRMLPRRHAKHVIQLLQRPLTTLQQKQKIATSATIFRPA
jgi:hypothetical protein